MKHLFIVNPVAGGKDRREYVAEQARRALEGSEDAYEVYVTTAPHGCMRQASPREAASGEELRVYAAAATARSTSASTAPPAAAMLP